MFAQVKPAVRVLMFVMLLMVNSARAQLIRLTSPEAVVVEKLVQNCRSCQDADGGISMANLGATITSPRWDAPYFGAIVALAFIANFDRTANRADLDRARNWLRWCAAHQRPDGAFNDWAGTRALYIDTGFCDGEDSSCAMYLVVLAQFQNRGGVVEPAMLTAARRAVAGLYALTDADGLTWAKQTYRVKYAMNNLEVFAGWRGAADIFWKRGEYTAAYAALNQASRMALALNRFWNPSRRLWAWALHPNGHYDIGLSTQYPENLAQLYALAEIRFDANLWSQLKSRFNPETSYFTGAGAERWLMAISRGGAAEAATWRGKVTAEASRWTSTSVYSHRSALVMLSLMRGANWIASPANPEVK